MHTDPSTVGSQASMKILSLMILMLVSNIRPLLLTSCSVLMLLKIKYQPPDLEESRT